ncbi:hypothetical protein DM860_011345 [Cuscuta australis]|uniref:RING-type domain-containing protein n=1 Tax=Cuscuta australis TaxID=267555 RepID=A0A328DPM1_9ASTE|nr:hypothetical protein DM860_011345 [Cuscuta australis]
MMEIVVSVALLLVGVVVLVFIHICIVGRALRGRNGINGTISLTPTRCINRSPNMSQEEIKKLPCFEYKVEIAEEEGQNGKFADCAVCLEGFKVGEKCRALQCHHCFHALCIDSWLVNNAACPICRAAAKGTPLKISLEEDTPNPTQDVVGVVEMA